MDREILFEMLAYVVITVQYMDRLGWGTFTGKREHMVKVMGKASAWIRKQALEMADIEGVHRGAALMLGLSCALAEGDFSRAIGFLDSLGVHPVPGKRYGPPQERIPFPAHDGGGLEDLQDK